MLKRLTRSVLRSRPVVGLVDALCSFYIHRRTLPPAEGAPFCWSWTTGAAGDLVLVDARNPATAQLTFDDNGARRVEIGRLDVAALLIEPRRDGQRATLALDGDATVFRLPAGRFGEAVARLWLHNAQKRIGPLGICRWLVVGDTGVPKPFDQGEGRRPELMRHYRSVIDLAATAAATDPLPERTGGPLVSLVVPVYNAAPRFLDDILRSFRAQPHGYAELVLSDDASPDEATRAWLRSARSEPGVRVIENAENGGIAAATNAGIAVASGEWIGLLDHDDALTPFAIDRVARALQAAPDCQFLYTDEVITDGDLRPDGYFLKPAWDRVLLSGVNYVNHLSLYRRERLQSLGCLAKGYDGSQDYELLLRYTAGLNEAEIVHLPYPAYLWRRSGDTFSARYIERAVDAARRALAARFGVERDALGPALDVNLHRIGFDRRIETWPSVSVVIPNRNAPTLIRQVVAGLRKGTDYPNLEIVIVDNGSDDSATLAFYDELRGDPRVIIDREVAEFNFSRAVNKGVALSSGQHLLLLNNDIEVLEPGWLKEMVSCFAYGDVGIVGAKLLYPDRTIQHAGVIVGLGDLAGHWFGAHGANDPGPMGRLWVRQSLSAVTGACLLVSRACWEATGPFDETAFAIAYNDVDFCMRANGAGFRVIWTPFACLVHHESATRGSDEAPSKIERFRREQDNLRRAHGTDRFEDPALNPWYSRGYADPFPVIRTTLPAPRRSWLRRSRSAGTTASGPAADAG